MLEMPLMNKTEIINGIIRTLSTVKVCKLSDIAISNVEIRVITDLQ